MTVRGAGLRAAVRRLERASASITDVCPECHLLPGGWPTPQTTFVAKCADEWDDDTPENCPRCGAQVVLHARIDGASKEATVHQ